jgi:MFS family permease
MQKDENVSVSVSKRNVKAFIWHGLFLALASQFMDVNTVIPSMLIKLGASTVHLGVLTAIMIGGASFMQLAFSFLLQNASFKKKHLLLGIYIRILMLLALGALFYYSSGMDMFWVLILVYVFITVFSFSGSYAAVSYVDIIGKMINKEQRKRFFSLKQVFRSGGVLFSALAAGWLLKVLTYPMNYFILFGLAGSLLFLASLGFWRIQENIPSGKNKISLSSFHHRMMEEWHTNHNLRKYLLIINTLGVGISMVPFLLMLYKENSGLSFDKVGDFLIFQTIGMLAGSLFIYFRSRKAKYQQILIFDVFLAITILFLALLLQGNASWYSLIFILTGLYFSTYKVVVEGILVEISSNENRTLYSGIAGAANLFPMLIPILIGILLNYFSYSIIFGGLMVLILTGLLPVLKLQCKQ